MKPHRLIALLSALVLLASACGGAVMDDIDDMAFTGPHIDEAEGGPGESAVGPDLAVLGQGSLEGKDVVVWFWAEW